MITYDKYGPHGSGSGPIWIVNAPTEPYPDERFDGPSRWEAIKTEPYGPTGAPLNPQQPTPEQIADAARLAVPNIALVFRIWPYRTTHPLDNLRALLALMLPDEWYP